MRVYNTVVHVWFSKIATTFFALSPDNAAQNVEDQGDSDRVWCPPRAGTILPAIPDGNRGSSQVFQFRTERRGGKIIIFLEIIFFFTCGVLKYVLAF